MHVQTYAHATPVLLGCYVLHSKTVLPKQTTKITVTTTHPRQCPQSRHITAAQGLRRKYEGVSFRMRSFHWAQPVWHKCTEHSKAENLQLERQISSTGGFTVYRGTMRALLSSGGLHTVYKCTLNMTNQRVRVSGWMDVFSWCARAAVLCACDGLTMKSIHHAPPLNGY